MRWVTAACILFALAACERSAQPRAEAAMSADQAIVRTSDLQAGAARTVTTHNPLEGDQLAQSDGRRLFLAMNCAACHGAEGGGSIGPPLRDADWIYGSDPAVIFQSVVQGRPNGMPAYGGKLPEEQIWRIVLYVESLVTAGAAERASGRGTTSGPSGSTGR